MHTWLLVGNYGVGNLGDEALKEFFLENVSNVHWVPMSASPTANEVPPFPAGIRSLFSFGWIRTYKALRESKGIVFGGGTLFTDIESVHAPILWCIQAAVARVHRKKIIMVFQGIGPWKTRVGKWCTKKVCQWSYHISVRDQLSKKRLEELGLNKKIVLTKDPVYLSLNKQKIDVSTQNVLIVIPRNNSGATLRKRLQEVLLDRTWSEVRVVSLQPDNVTESHLCQILVEAVGELAMVAEVRTLEDLIAHMKDAAFVLTERFHGGVAAIALEKQFEVVAQASGDKLSGLTSVSMQSAVESITEELATLQTILAN